MLEVVSTYWVTGRHEVHDSLEDSEVTGTCTTRRRHKSSGVRWVKGFVRNWDMKFRARLWWK